MASPLADARTNHFGSRDALIAAGLAHARSELLTACRDRLRAERGVHDWLPQFTELLRPTSTGEAHAQAQATLALAVIRGLMLDENATQEQARVDAAFEVFEDL